MSDVYLIEVGGRPVGLVARDEDGKTYRFHAAVPKAFALDGHRFKSPEQAYKAVLKDIRPANGRSTELNHAA